MCVFILHPLQKTTIVAVEVKCLLQEDSQSGMDVPEEELVVVV